MSNFRKLENWGKNKNKIKKFVLNAFSVQNIFKICVFMNSTIKFVFLISGFIALTSISKFHSHKFGFIL